MDTSLKKRLLKHSFWLSILLHILFLLSISTVFYLVPEEEPPHPSYYVPAYTTQAPSASTAQAGASKPTKTDSQPTEAKNEKQDKVEKQAEATPTQTRTSSPHGLMKRSMLAASQSILKQMQHEAITSKRESDPIYLVGDSNQEADPLTKLVARALSTHFNYPRSAGQFGISGVVVVEFTLHPEGYITDIRMQRSSHSEDLDAAALYAVNAAPEVKGASRFINKPKHMVIGFIFKLVHGGYY